MSQAKQQKTGQRSLGKSRRALNREAQMLLLIGIPTIIIATILISVYNTGKPASAPVDETQLIRADSPTLGPPDAPVTIVEFLDPECEACRAAYPAVKKLLEDYEGQVRLVVRYFPLHNNSVLAATAKEAAGEQGKYWEMQDVLFTRQTEWGEQNTPQTETFISYARELDLDIERFTAALDNPTFRAKIERDRQDGTALGVKGTPTFFVNGQLVEPLSYERLIEMIEAGL